MWKITKQYCQDIWNYIWDNTTVDEKAIATIKEIKRRGKLTHEELKDVAKAFKEVGNQIGDIPGALKGKSRKGRKSGGNK